MGGIAHRRATVGNSLVRLAESLGLTLRERNRLLLAAGYAAVYPESGFDDPDLRPVHDALRGDGELHLISTLTSFSTATDVTLAELHLEAFLPADEATATILRRRRANSEASLVGGRSSSDG
jgi:hypothetical protein